jgi:hypothetical protein
LADGRLHCDGYCDGTPYIPAGRAATLVMFCEVREAPIFLAHGVGEVADRDDEDGDEDEGGDGDGGIDDPGG